MFDFDNSPIFVAPVPLCVPGAAQPWDVNFTFKHKGKKQLAEWVSGWPGRQDHDVLNDVIEGWDVKRKGEAVPYSITALADLLDRFPASNREIRDAYLREMTESKRKNS